MCELNCPMGLFALASDGMHFTSDADELCIMCGHCIAACPKDVVSIEGLAPEMFPKLADSQATPGQLQELMDGRRSVRRFSDRPVEREKLERMIEAVSTAPTGEGGQPPPVTVVNGREKLEPMVAPMMAFFRKFHRGMKSPIFKHVFRLMLGKHQYAAMKKFMPIMERMMEYYDATGEDCIMWGAPAILIFHTPPDNVGAKYDPIISCTYAMLAAHAEGLGTTMIGMVPPYLNEDAAAKERLGIPKGNEVVLSLIAGYPKVTFSRGIRRKVDANWV